jgi:hypothetical protein
MEKPTWTLEQSDKKYGGFYRLIPPKKTFFQRVKQLALGLILLPYSIFQTIIGRLLSYLVINPLFRKQEKNETLILQHPKHPDPLFSEMDEMSVINVYPTKNLFLRVLLNWHTFFVNHVITLQAASSIFGWLSQHLPGEHGYLHKISDFLSGQAYVTQFIDTIVDQVSAQIQGKKDKPLQPNQIHFRGIERLSAEQQETLYQKLEARHHYNFRHNRNNIYFYSLQTADNAVLDSVEVRSPNTSAQNISERRFIIAAMPRSNNFVDWLRQYKIYAKELNATIIAFNYRGVGLSKGLITDENSLYTDAYSQAQRLLQLGARPENIAMMGECLGGNIATHTAGTLHQEGFRVKLFSARSFRSLTSIIEGRAAANKEAPLWHPSRWLSWARYGLVKLILIPVIHSARWSLNVDKQFLVIPPHDRDFMVVRSKKDEQGKRFADDRMIPYQQASIYSLVKEKTKAIAKKKEHGAPLSEVEGEWLRDRPKQHKFYVSEEHHSNARKANGHTVHPRLLAPTNPSVDSSSKDGRQYTLNFFKRVWPDNNLGSSENSMHEPSCSV